MIIRNNLIVKDFYNWLKNSYKKIILFLTINSYGTVIALSKFIRKQLINKC